MSLGDSLREMNPVFYIETDMSMTADRAVLDSQLDAYLQMDDYLAAHDYEICFIFDNFGNLLCTGTPETMKYIHRYMYRMAVGRVIEHSIISMFLLAARNSRAYVLMR